MSAVTIDLGEAEAIVSDLDEAISEILDAMLLNTNERERLSGAMMKVVSARFIVRCLVREAFKARDEQEEQVPS